MAINFTQQQQYNNIPYRFTDEQYRSDAVNSRSDQADNADIQRTRTVSDRTIRRSMTEQSPDWRIRSARKQAENRYGVQKNITLAVVTVLAVSSTILKFNARIQLILYFLFGAVLFIANPLDALGRFVSLPCRILISISCGSMVLLGCRPGLDTFFLTIAVIAVTALSIKYMNNAWLSAESWRMTDAVQKSLQHDPHSMAAKNWQADGRREVKTALYEMGLNVDDDTLDVQRGIFEIGYNHGLQKMHQVNSMADKLETARSEAKQAAGQIRRLESDIEEQTAEVERLQAVQAENDATTDYYKRLYNKLLKQNEQLQTANSELLEALEEQESEENQMPDNVVKLTVVKSPEEIEAEKIAGMTRDEKLAYARYELNLSYAGCGQFAGCSKSTAQNVLKAADLQKAEA